MPSPKDPSSTVNPGPGKLPAGTVTASSLMFPSGGGGGAALTAHITDPVDAHMASAIGVNPTDRWLKPLLPPYGPIDGESVRDFISMTVDMFPVPPNRLGYDREAGADDPTPNTGFPSWGFFGPAGVMDRWYNTGYATVVQFTRGSTWVGTYRGVPAADYPGSTGMQVFVAPADRGVLAMYHSDDGTWTNPAVIQLVGALYLGSDIDEYGNTINPAGIPSASFNEYYRSGHQADHYVGAGVDQFGLYFRYPYLRNYGLYGAHPPYDNYIANFYSYQVAILGFYFGTFVAEDLGGYLLVHWKETYATSLTAIEPTAFVANYTSYNCYSQVSTSDSGTYGGCLINNIFMDSGAATPTPISFTVSNFGGSVSWLSGVSYYNNGFIGFDCDLDTRADGVFANSYHYGSPTYGYPLSLDYSDMGGEYLHSYAVTQLKDPGTGLFYSSSNPPSPASSAQRVSTNVYVPYSGFPPETTPIGGVAYIKAVWSKPFATSLVQPCATGILFNSCPQLYGNSHSTKTFEPFKDERFRYKSNYTPSSASVTVEPSAGNHIVTSAAFASSGLDLQVIGDQLVYPKVDFSVYVPTGPDYAAVYAGDPALHGRFYIRAFNTGVARNTGRIRIKGVPASAFAPGVWTGSAAVDHPGGVGLFVRVPGSTVWLDLARAKGDPVAGIGVDGYGCMISMETVGTNEYIITYDTTAFTSAYSGDFPLFFGIVMFKGTGDTNVVDEVEWLAP